MDTKRFMVRDFLGGCPLVVDRLEKTLTYYESNVYGEIFNLKDPGKCIVDLQKIREVINRTNKRNYNQLKSPAIDAYIFEYIMTPDQQALCGTKHLMVPSYDKIITETDDYAEVIRKMVVWAFEHRTPRCQDDKEAERARLLQECEDYLAELQSAASMPQKNPFDIDG